MIYFFFNDSNVGYARESFLWEPLLYNGWVKDSTCASQQSSMGKAHFPSYNEKKALTAKENIKDRT